MKPHTSAEMHEGPEAFTRFRNALKHIVSVPHEEIKRREAEYRKRADANPNKRGPKPKKHSA